MSLERNIQVVANYEQKKIPNLASALTYVDSIHTESNRVEDKYQFWVGEEGIIDPATFDYIHNIVSPGSHDNPYLGLVEYSILWQLDNWSRDKNSKLAVWISPSKKGEPKCKDHKIIIHQIDYSPAGERKVNNTSIIFQGEQKICLDIAQKISKMANNLKTPEEVRSLLLVVENNTTIADILELIEPHIQKNDNYTPISEETKHYLANLYIQGRSNLFIAQEWARLGALGEFDLECVGGGSTSFSDILSNNSLTLNTTTPEGQSKYVRNCGNCGAVINAHISAGYICPHCGGVYKGC